MKMLVHRIANGTASAVALHTAKNHMRVSHNDDDAAIAIMIDAATAEIEQFAQIALLNQTIRVVIFDPAIECSLTLPIGPTADDTVPTVTIDGEPFTAFTFEGGARPYIRWRAPFYELLPDRLTIEYQAGFGASEQDVPRDLAQAVMDQAALYYDGRSPMGAKSLTTSPHMARIAARYRGVSL
ncbi:head-tail connector protein [Phaeovulum sp.]|uniref:head-tail connector protein n=1 Tax=Phaeovulum sp. TaxID=2934796 RepID=UPI0039E365C4